MASAAGLQNFVRTLSGAIATSIVTTSWDDRTAAVHADLAGAVDRTGDAARALGAGGMQPEAVTAMLDKLLGSQSVMLATNQIMWIVAGAFVVAALVIWVAPRPTHAVDPMRAGQDDRDDRCAGVQGEVGESWGDRPRLVGW